MLKQYFTLEEEFWTLYKFLFLQLTAFLQEVTNYVLCRHRLMYNILYIAYLSILTHIYIYIFFLHIYNVYIS